MKDEQNVTAIKEVKREGMIKSCPKKEWVEGNHD